MIADHIIGKEKPFSTQTKFDEQPYEIPDNWRYERFGTIMINRDAERIPLSASSRASKEKKYDYYGASGVIDKTDSFLFDKELLLIGEDGANLLSRSTPIAFIASGKYWVNNHAHVLDVCCGLNLQYICYYINSIDLSIYVTGTAQPKMNQSNMNAIWVPVPPIEEQQRIVDTIKEIMPRIDEYEKIEKGLEVLKKEFPTNMKDALLQAAMQGKLTEQLESDSSVDELLEEIKQEKKELIAQKKIKKEKPLPDIEEEEIPFDIPENWRWEKVGNICDCGAGATPARSDRRFYDDGTIFWLKTGELTDGYIYKCEEKISQIALEKCSLRLNKKGDVLIAMYGATIGKLGIVTFPLTTNQACCGCRPYSGVYNLYLFYYLMSSKKDLIGKAEGGAQPNISREKIRNSLIPIPPLEEQQRIVERLEALLPLCEDLKE